MPEAHAHRSNRRIEGVIMNGKRLMDVINNADFDRQYAELNWSGTFEDYLDMVVERPAIARTAFQRIYDMIASYGSYNYTEYKKQITHFKFLTIQSTMVAMRSLVWTSS